MVSDQYFLRKNNGTILNLDMLLMTNKNRVSIEFGYAVVPEVCPLK